MRHTKDILNILTRLLIKSGILLASVALSTNALAATGETTYIDSVHNWGAWALDIEPAAGGLHTEGTQPLNARSAKLTLRTNSIAAISPRRIPGDIAIPQSPAPVAPTVPAIPTITPVSPSVPIPTGGPAIPGGAP
ncbi:hypothetical protein MNBD_GAMMA05-1816 [hydrothermal vent metagenome]|uniref:Uncharacterized protein n=1 Tax=hydrothermal vent metagenome TaxID=652676 RepID=A0A3B0XE08_9ZZZZ